MFIIAAIGPSQAADLTVDNGSVFTLYQASMSYDNEFVGYNNNGIFNQSAGTVFNPGGGTNTVAQYLYVGFQPGSNGAYNLDAGSLSAAQEHVGFHGTGTFTQSAGTNTIAGNLGVGFSFGGSGTYLLNGGDLSANTESIGYDGTGTVTQTGGNNTTGELTIGRRSSGIYNLNGGQLNADSERIGYFGTGTFNQNGGTNTTGQLRLGDGSGTASYTLTGGALISETQVINSANFTQNGGSNKAGSFDIAGSSGRNAGYALNGGSLTARDQTIGNFSSLIQSGGENTVTGSLTLGSTAGGGSGTYILNGGTLSAFSESIGGRPPNISPLPPQYTSGNGIFTQNSGSNTIADTLYVGSQRGAGTYNLNGGSLTATDLYVGTLYTATFTQTGGVNTVSRNMFLGGGFLSDASYNLTGGSLSAQYISLRPKSTFNQTGGMLNAAAFYQQGGEVRGSLENRGTFNYWSGPFSGRLLNYGAVILKADFTAENGVSNYSAVPFVIDSGRTVTLNGNGLDNQATVILNGTLAGNGTLLNNTTGILSGTGTVMGNLTNNGTIRPGNSPGTLNIQGDYTQTLTGAMEIEIASPTSYDRLIVSGNASINGSVRPILLGGYIPALNQTFSFLRATGGMSGSFNVEGQFITPTILWQPHYSDNGLDLVFARDYTNSGLTLTGNQRSVGTALNGVSDSASGDLNTILTAIDNLPTGATITNSFNQMSPEKVASLSTLSFAGADLQKRILARRITDIWFETREIGNLAGDWGMVRPVLAFNSSDLSGLFTGNGGTHPSNPWGLYFDPAVIIATQGSTGNQTGYEFTVAGFSAGIDYRLRNDLLIGLATGYNHTEADFHNAAGAVRGDTLPITAYIAYIPDSFYVYGSLGYSLNLFDLHRKISFGGLDRTAKSSPEGDMLNAYAEAGYEFKTGRFFITPMASISYSNLWLGDFTENGAGAINLKVFSQNAESLRSGFGGRFSAPVMWGSIPLVTQLHATWQHEFLNDSRSLDARLSQGSPVFTFRTDSPERDFAVVGTSLTLAARKDLKVRLDYSVEAGQDHYTAHYLSAGVRWEF